MKWNKEPWDRFLIWLKEQKPKFKTERVKWSLYLLRAKKQMPTITSIRDKWYFYFLWIQKQLFIFRQVVYSVLYNVSFFNIKKMDLVILKEEEGYYSTKVTSSFYFLKGIFLCFSFVCRQEGLRQWWILGNIYWCKEIKKETDKGKEQEKGKEKNKASSQESILCCRLVFRRVSNMWFVVGSLPYKDMVCGGIPFWNGFRFFARNDSISRMDIYESMEDGSLLYIGYFLLNNKDFSVVYTELSSEGSFTFIPVVPKFYHVGRVP